MLKLNYSKNHIVIENSFRNGPLGLPLIPCALYSRHCNLYIPKTKKVELVT